MAMAQATTVAEYFITAKRDSILYWKYDYFDLMTDRSFHEINREESKLLVEDLALGQRRQCIYAWNLQATTEYVTAYPVPQHSFTVRK